MQPMHGHKCMNTCTQAGRPSGPLSGRVGVGVSMLAHSSRSPLQHGGCGAWPAQRSAAPPLRCPGACMRAWEAGHHDGRLESTRSQPGIQTQWLCGRRGRGRGRWSGGQMGAAAIGCGDAQRAEDSDRRAALLHYTQAGASHSMTNLLTCPHMQAGPDTVRRTHTATTTTQLVVMSWPIESWNPTAACQLRSLERHGCIYGPAPPPPAVLHSAWRALSAVRLTLWPCCGRPATEAPSLARSRPLTTATCPRGCCCGCGRRATTRPTRRRPRPS